MRNSEYIKLTDSGINLLEYSELARLEQNGGSSYYLFDARKLRENISNLRAALGHKVFLSYSMKANPWLAECAKEYVDCLEICSPGELKKVMENGWDLDKVTLDGLLKTPEEIGIALQKGVQRLSIDSLCQWKMVQECAKGSSRKINVLLRLTSGNQFGMDMEEIVHILERKSGSQALHIEGIHFYAGTQKKSAGEVKKLFQYLENALDEIEERTGNKLELVELGGGAPVPYFLEDDRAEYQKAYETLAECVRTLSERISIVYEAGRILVASAGCYVSKVIDCKARAGGKIVLIDGGTHQLTYYGAVAGRKTPEIKSVSHGADMCADEESVTVCGSLCTAQDIMARRVKLKKTEPGAYLVFGLAGAYSVTECGSDFLSRTKPAILLRRENSGLEVLRAVEEIDFLQF